MRISTNAGALQARMRKRAAQARSEFSRAAEEVAPVLNAEAKREMQRGIYDVPIPADERKRRKRRAPKGKRGRWRRTGALKRREMFRTEGASVLLTNDQVYAVPRYTLGTPGGRRIRTRGVRSVQWQAAAVASKRNYVLERRRAAALRVLGVR